LTLRVAKFVKNMKGVQIQIVVTYNLYRSVLYRPDRTSTHRGKSKYMKYSEEMLMFDPRTTFRIFGRFVDAVDTYPS